MAEFCIKRVDNTNDDQETDRRGCYKRGDVIEIGPDGSYQNQPHLTVLVVNGLDHEKIMKFMEERKELVSTKVAYTDEEYNFLKNLSEEIIVNDKIYVDFKLGVGIDPQLQKEEDGKKFFNIQKFETYTRRRFIIPTDMMNSLFPEGIYRVEISSEEFLEKIKGFYDKSYENFVENTSWYAEFIKEIA